jgi:glyoxylase I family protein
LALKVANAAGQQEIQRRLEAAAFETMVIDHGYCVSLYVTDPNGLNLEFTVDHPAAERIAAKRSASAHEDLRRWLAGDRSTNNEWRVETKSAAATS